MMWMPPPPASAIRIRLCWLPHGTGQLNDDERRDLLAVNKIATSDNQPSSQVRSPWIAGGRFLQTPRQPMPSWIASKLGRLGAC